VCSENFQEMQGGVEYLDLCAGNVGFVYVRAKMQECEGRSSAER
jgi:hypothetical protein